VVDATERDKVLGKHVNTMGGRHVFLKKSWTNIYLFFKKYTIFKKKKRFNWLL